MTDPTRSGGATPRAHRFSALVNLALIVGFWTAGPALARPARLADGVWAGSYEIAGYQRKLVLALGDRADGRLIGYVIGGTGQRTVVTSHRTSRDVTIQIELKTPAGPRIVTVNGTLSGQAIRGTATDRTATAKVALRLLKDKDVLHERRFVVALPGAGGDPTLIAELAVALDHAGDLAAGGWVGVAGCDPWGGCDGEITSFSESAGVLTIGFRNDDPCSAGSTLTAAFDPATNIYSGSYRLNTCAGPVTEPALAARSTRTRSDHAQQIVRALGDLADDLEAGVPLSPPHPSFSPGYLERGTDLAALLAMYNADMAAYDDIVATVGRISLVSTVAEPQTPFEPIPFGAVFEEDRRGIPAGGTTPITYLDSATIPGRPWLRIWAGEPSGWVLRGNQLPALDLPFAYSVGPQGIEVPYGDGSAGFIHVSLGPFGAHFEPLTGHSYGDAKANLIGFYTASDADLATLPTGQKAYFGGPGGSLLLARRPLYVAPEDAVMGALRCFPSTGLGGELFQWVVELRLGYGETLQIGHLGRLAPSLVSRLARLGLPTTCVSPDGTNLLGGLTLPIARGEALARPQVVAVQVAAGYFVGGGTIADRPWAQMEFFLTVPVADSAADACYYDYIPSDVRAPFQSALSADIADPDSQRYRNPRHPRWRWAAEGRLCMAPWTLPRDFSDLYTNLGGWFEKDGPGSIVSDEIVAFAPIARDVASYDPAAYTTGVTMLMLRQRARPGSFLWLLPGTPPLPVFAFNPAGEILERGPDSLLVLWRDLATSHPSVYQRAAYLLDATGLKIGWGNFAATAAGATLPALSAATPCDGVDVVCYDHTFHVGY